MEQLAFPDCHHNTVTVFTNQTVKLRDFEMQNKERNWGRKIKMSLIVPDWSTAHRVLVAPSPGI
jgi:hypothetical protein